MSKDGVNKSRRRVLTAMTSAVGAAGLVGAAVPFVGSWNPSAKAKAAGAPVEVNVAKLEPGQMITIEWQGKPVYVLRRTPEIIAGLDTLDSRVRDPSSEAPQQPAYVQSKSRAIKDEFLVLLAVCTHLGCAPAHIPETGAQDIGDSTWIGGFFCRCHGSKFDLAGRVFQGVPAPTNLLVPPHKYLSDGVILIGEDQEA
ncbi:MAG: ubiquinol-cytochrome c reductase iron-sulfur subunit [Flavobacteriales bacterium]